MLKRNISRTLLFACVLVSWLPSNAFVPPGAMLAFSPQLAGVRPQCALRGRIAAHSILSRRRLSSSDLIRTLRCSASSEEKTGELSEKQIEFDNLIRDGTAKKCVNILRSSEDVAINEEQAWKLLSSIPLDFATEGEGDQQLLTSYAYSSLRKRQILKGFGCIEATPTCLPYQSRDIDVPTLERVIGMSLASLTPRGTEFSWQLAGLGLCALEFVLAKSLGVDPLRTVIPLTAASFILDRTLLSGAVFESFYRLVFPEYKNKVIRHEAGHLLLAYLMGCPIQGFFLSAWDATRAGIRGQGQAGCVFFDNDLSSGISANKVTRTAIDRYSIVVMGGIAAEAMSYGRSE